MNREDKNVGLILPELGGDQFKATCQAHSAEYKIDQLLPSLKETTVAFLGDELTIA